jgi:hypothetical protein
MNLNSLNIKDLIKRGFLSYNLGDDVILFRRKNNGYPNKIKDDITYTIEEINHDGHVFIREKNSDLFARIKVHKSYLINKSILREIKLNSILGETNQNHSI